KMVLRMHHARPVTRESAPDLVGLVEQLARRAEPPMPAVYILDTDQPNAAATGRNPENSAVAVTRGLLRACDSEALAGVIAHELAHIKHRDTLIMTVTATLAGAIGFLAQFAFFFGGNRDERNPLGLIGTLAVMIRAPLAAMLVQMAISRTREYSADRAGAMICGQPLWLARALQRIEQLARGVVNEPAERNPASAHLFIVNPLRMGGVDNLFRTHPPTADRVRRLREPAGAAASSSPGGPWGWTRRRRAAAPGEPVAKERPGVPSGRRRALAGRLEAGQDQVVDVLALERDQLAQRRCDFGILERDVVEQGVADEPLDLAREAPRDPIAPQVLLACLPVALGQRLGVLLDLDPDELPRALHVRVDFDRGRPGPGETAQQPKHNDERRNRDRNIRCHGDRLRQPSRPSWAHGGCESVSAARTRRRQRQEEVTGARFNSRLTSACSPRRARALSSASRRVAPAATTSSTWPANRASACPSGRDKGGPSIRIRRAGPAQSSALRRSSVRRRASSSSRSARGSPGPSSAKRSSSVATISRSGCSSSAASASYRPAAAPTPNRAVRPPGPGSASTSSTGRRRA